MARSDAGFLLRSGDTVHPFPMEVHSVSMEMCRWGDHVYRAAMSKSRPGFVASACIRCGKFLGRCPLDEFGCGPGEPAPGGRYMDDQPEFLRARKKPKRSLRPMLD